MKLALVRSMWFALASLVAISIVFVGTTESVAASHSQQLIAGAKGKKLYDINCSSCHGSSGQGDGNSAQALDTQPKPFSKALKNRKESEVLKIISEGKGQMPGWSRVLSKDQIREIYQYIKTL